MQALVDAGAEIEAINDVRREPVRPGLYRFWGAML